ncbi:DMT family transporter [Amphritea sp. 2_MG-2023]|jgi:drug/metabolite transporter (DMT)-like permease|uniref:DMT family transporter n=1 Tax=Amphritea TaxID=515417 RepID=UPI001C071CA8|nr:MULTISPECIES: DMT family transporter [Amphritea]MBU2965417.1 DMT family transporter [Amphritea atlantica]MDO6420707.1 DMT family transporter [Amphritea sp. 2_MG-2023]MDX2422900.1 DMT family transporter [Amphritea sp.]
MPYFLLSMTVLFWAGNFVTARGVHGDFPPLTMSFMRWGLALLIILPFLLPRLRRKWPIISANLPILIVLSVLSVVCFNSFIYLGVQTTQATNATLMQSAIPIIILIFTSLFLGETVVRRQWLGVCISLLGIIVLVSKGDPDILLTFSFNTGDLWILAGVLCWSIYSVMLRLKPMDLDGFTFFGFTVVIGVIVLFPFMLWEFLSGARPVWNPQTLSTIVYMAICPSILAYIFWNRGVAELGPAKAGLFIHLMPPFGLILSVIFLNEAVEPFHFIGIGLIFSGIYLAIITGRRHNEKKSPA